MSNTGKPKIEELAGELILWNAYRDVHRAKGTDIAQVFTRLAADQKQRLRSPGAREDFAELCKDGCFPIALASIVALLRYSTLLERFWAEMVGRRDSREKATRTLEHAAQLLEKLFSNAIALESEGEGPELAKIGRLPISGVVSELRFYIRFIDFAESLSGDTETRSFAELSKYLLTSYVRRMTSRFHDRSVSSLVGEVAGLDEYNEVAHRMWRGRNYARIEKHHSWMVRFLVAMSVVIAHTT
jgi:hypothetical protein